MPAHNISGSNSVDHWLINTYHTPPGPYPLSNILTRRPKLRSLGIHVIVWYSGTQVVHILWKHSKTSKTSTNQDGIVLGVSAQRTHI